MATYGIFEVWQYVKITLSIKQNSEIHRWIIFKTFVALQIFPNELNYMYWINLIFHSSITIIFDLRYQLKILANRKIVYCVKSARILPSHERNSFWHVLHRIFFAKSARKLRYSVSVRYGKSEIFIYCEISVREYGILAYFRVQECTFVKKT